MRAFEMNRGDRNHAQSREAGDDIAGFSLFGHLNATSFSRFNSASMSVPS
jgi:hypothetical protein